MLASNDKLIKTLLKKGKLKVYGNGSVKGQKPDIHGYYVRSYKSKSLKCHRIAYQYFYGNLKPTHQINHKDGNKKNNSRTNLEQITKSQNIRHMFKTVARQRITFRQAENIRTFYNTGSYSQTSLAKKYRCSTRYIQHIIHKTRRNKK